MTGPDTDRPQPGYLKGSAGGHKINNLAAPAGSGSHANKYNKRG